MDILSRDEVWEKGAETASGSEPKSKKKKTSDKADLSGTPCHSNTSTERPVSSEHEGDLSESDDDEDAAGRGKLHLICS